MLSVFLLYHPGDQEVIYVRLSQPWASLIAQLVKNLPAVQETWVQSLGPEDPLRKEMATRSSTLAWRIPQRSLAGYSPWGRKSWT